MKSRITKTVALAALMAGTAGVANATEGWYGRADIGWSFDGTQDLDGAAAEGTLEHDWTEHLGLGYAFQNGFRLEGELGHRFNQVEFSGFPTVDADVHAWSAMANLFYDFNRGGALEPYIGIGAGAARLNTGLVDGGTTIDGEDTVIAYQALAGVAIGLTEQLDLDIGYRYFVADGAEFDEGTFVTEGDYEHQALTVGLRYQFAAPAPAYVAPPPVAPPVTPPPPPPVATCPTSELRSKPSTLL